MPTAEPPTEVVVRVKVPPGHIQSETRDEFTLGSLSTSLTVAALRARIQTLVPSNPLPQHQRILYGGRALIEDEQSLADALNTKRDPSQREYVVHLLIRDGAEHGRSGGNTPHLQHAEHRPLQPQPVHVQAVNLPGMPHIPHVQQYLNMQPGAFGVQGMMRAPSRPGSRPGQSQDAQQNGQNTQAQPQSARQNGSVPRPHHHHHHHHHHPHAHHHTPVPQDGLPPRPVSGQDVHVEGIGPNGERFAIHQQTLNMPFGAGQHGQIHLPMPMGFPGMPAGFPGVPFQAGHVLPHGMIPPQMPPGVPLPMPMPGMAQQPQAQTQPPVSALDRARTNMGEMRRMINELRAQNATEDAQRRINELEQRIQVVDDFIDPFHVGVNPRPRAAAQPGTTAEAPTTAQRAAPAMQFQQPTQHQPLNFGLPFPLLHNQIHRPPSVRPHQSFPAPVSAYLLSSPEGPRALVITPQYGTFASAPQPQGGAQVTAANNASFNNAVALQPTRTVQAEGANDQAAQPAIAAQGEAAANAAPQQGDPLAIMGPLINHLWLLLRIGVFAYFFLLGSNLGWRRPVALGLIGLGFWMIRMGLLGNGGVLRRWWDDVVRVDDVGGRMRGRLQRIRADVDAAVGPGRPEAADGVAAEPQVNAQRGQAAQAQQGQMPTPEELAERLQREHDPLRRLRDQIRPVERALALFAASLWPGVGERYVQALDQARAEEEAAQRELARQQEQAQQAQQAVEENKDTDQAAEEGNANAGSSEKQTGGQTEESSTAAAVAQGTSSSAEHAAAASPANA